MTVWDQVLVELRTMLPEEDFRRWFGATAYASDSGDQITVWVPAEGIRRHIETHFSERIDRALHRIGRGDTFVRFVVGGTDEDEDQDDD